MSDILHDICKSDDKLNYIAKICDDRINHMDLAQLWETRLLQERVMKQWEVTN
jgi:hypothetical protein